MIEGLTYSFPVSLFSYFVTKGNINLNSYEKLHFFMD